MQDALADRPTRSFLLVDDDEFSARFFTSQLKVTAAGQTAILVKHLDSATAGVQTLQSMSEETHLGELPDMVVSDLKSSSSANLKFLSEVTPILNHSGVSIVVFTSANEPKMNKALIDAGAVAVFERHSDLEKYRGELESLLELSEKLAKAA